MWINKFLIIEKQTLNTRLLIYMDRNKGILLSWTWEIKRQIPLYLMNKAFSLGPWWTWMGFLVRYEKMVPGDGRKWHLSKTIKNSKCNKELLYRIQYWYAMACILVRVLHACVWDTLVIIHAYLDGLFFLHSTTSHVMNASPSKMHKMYQDKLSQKEIMCHTST